MMRGEDNSSWTFLTNHTHVMLCLWMESDIRIRDVAEKVGITERSAQNIIYDLEKAGLLTKEKVGRRNHYKINAKAALRHPMEKHCKLESLLILVANTVKK